MSTSLLDLPPELIEGILVLCDPVDVARASMVCQRLYGMVYGDYRKEGMESEARPRRKVFWRALYLNQPLDDLRSCVDWLGTRRVPIDGQPDGDIDWEKELQGVVRARYIASNVGGCIGEGDLQKVLTTFLGLARWVPLNRGDDLAENLVWVPVTLEGFLDSVEKGIPSTSSDSGQPQPSSWILPPKAHWRKETKQLHSQLHTLYGLTRSDLTNRRRSESRAWVYDMRKYTRENDYGPLRDGGKRVDWEFMERIHHVMSMHVVWESVKGWIQSRRFESDSGSEIEPRFQYMLYPMSMPFTHSWYDAEAGEAANGIPMVEVGLSIEEESELPESVDWAGIGGEWSICFCFCDHHDLIAFNQSADPETGCLDVSFFEDEFSEDFKRLEVTLHITRVENDPEHPGRPIIEFLGVMEAPSTSTMQGVVQVTADDHIKWQFYSGELEGSAVWSSVGIQVGGIGSSYGILGSWTTVFHDEDDPVGPFWMQRQA